MARIPAPTSRSSRNVRNGPSPLQARLSGLFREARWILFAALAAWLILVLATWNPADPAWSHSVHAGATMNGGGTFGAHVSDFLLFLFGFSAWLRSEEHTSELQSLMRISYAVFCLKKK